MAKTNPGFNDLKLAGRVRTLALTEMERVLTGTDEAYKKELILRIASNTLPRLNEHSGPDGGDIPLPILGGINAVHKNNSPEQDSNPV